MNAEVRQEGLFDGADRGEMRRERREDHRKKKLERQERKETRKEQQDLLRIDANALLSADAACVRSAITKRENAMLSAFDTLSASIRNALVSRKTALTAAWTAGVSASDRETAIRASWEAYGTSLKDANTTFREQQKATYTTWRNDAKGCLPTDNGN